MYKCYIMTDMVRLYNCREFETNASTLTQTMQAFIRCAGLLIACSSRENSGDLIKLSSMNKITLVMLEFGDYLRYCLDCTIATNPPVFSF